MINIEKETANGNNVSYYNNEIIQTYGINDYNNNDDDIDGKRSDGEVYTLDLWGECKLFFQIAAPTSTLQFLMLWIFPLTASVVGKTLGSEELASFSLASMVGNLTCVSVIIGTLSGCETLQPRAMGLKQYNEVGLIALRGIFTTTLLLLPLVTFLLTNLESTLVNWGGQDEVTSHLASRWIKVYLLGLPSVLIFRTTQRFLSCQNIVMPCVYAAAIAAFVVHPIILPYLIHQFGFIGSGLAISISQSSLCLVTLLYLRWKQPHEPQTWSIPYNNNSNNKNWSCHNHCWIILYFQKAILPVQPLHDYIRLSIGGVLSLSEWWFWETICFLVGRMGLIPLCVHTIAYQIIPLCWMLPLGVSIGASVRIGTVLATHDVLKAQSLAKYSILTAMILGFTVSMTLCHYQSVIVSLFTNDPDVVVGCQLIWKKVCIDIFILHIFCVQSGILRALGLQWAMAAIIFLILWCITLPCVLYCGHNLNQIWTILPCAYTILVISLFWKIITVDWYKISDDICRKEKSLDNESPTERSLLL